jgi:hypothetical protein
VSSLEDSLGDLEKLYPSIPAIEVTIPHFLASVNSTYLKKMIEANKKFVV